MKYLLFIAPIVSIIQYFDPSFFLNSERYYGIDFGDAGYLRRIPSIFTWVDLPFIPSLSIGMVVMFGILVVEYRNNKTLSILLPVAAGIVVFISQMRVAMLTYLIVILVLIVRRISIKLMIYSLVLLVTFTLLINFLAFPLDYFIEKRLKSETAMTRVQAFVVFLHAFPDSPYFGTGGEKTEAVSEGFGNTHQQMHNAHLNIAYHYGIFAFIAHSLFILFLSIRTYKTGKRTKYWPPFVGMICYIAATNTLPSGHFLDPGLILMMVYHKYYVDRHQTMSTSWQRLNPQYKMTGT
jgi:hypothetical protein